MNKKLLFLLNVPLILQAITFNEINDLVNRGEYQQALDAIPTLRYPDHNRENNERKQILFAIIDRWDAVPPSAPFGNQINGVALNNLMEKSAGEVRRKVAALPLPARAMEVAPAPAVVPPPVPPRPRVPSAQPEPAVTPVAPAQPTLQPAQPTLQPAQPSRLLPTLAAGAVIGAIGAYALRQRADAGPEEQAQQPQQLPRQQVLLQELQAVVGQEQEVRQAYDALLPQLQEARRNINNLQAREERPAEEIARAQQQIARLAPQLSSLQQRATGIVQQAQSVQQRIAQQPAAQQLVEVVALPAPAPVSPAQQELGIIVRRTEQPAARPELPRITSLSRIAQEVAGVAQGLQQAVVQVIPAAPLAADPLVPARREDVAPINIAQLQQAATQLVPLQAGEFAARPGAVVVLNPQAHEAFKLLGVDVTKLKLEGDGITDARKLVMREARIKLTQLHPDKEKGDAEKFQNIVNARDLILKLIEQGLVIRPEPGILPAPELTVEDARKFSSAAKNLIAAYEQNLAKKTVRGYQLAREALDEIERDIKNHPTLGDPYPGWRNLLRDKGFYPDPLQKIAGKRAELTRLEQQLSQPAAPAPARPTEAETFLKGTPTFDKYKALIDKYINMTRRDASVAELRRALTIINDIGYSYRTAPTFIESDAQTNQLLKENKLYPFATLNKTAMNLRKRFSEQCEKEARAKGEESATSCAIQ